MHIYECYSAIHNLRGHVSHRHASARALFINRDVSSELFALISTLALYERDYSLGVFRALIIQGCGKQMVHLLPLFCMSRRTTGTLLESPSDPGRCKCVPETNFAMAARSVDSKLPDQILKLFAPISDLSVLCMPWATDCSHCLYWVFILDSLLECMLNNNALVSMVHDWPFLREW